jgi:hypothetical protein
MAKVNLYVPDSMKVQMDQIGERANWSGVAQAAFAQEINRLSWPKDLNMEDVVSRLRASKAKYVEQQNAEGRKQGREWAMKRAEFNELRSLASIDFDYVPEGWNYARYADHALGIDPTEEGDSFWFDPEGSPTPDEYVEAFVKGAREVWDQVEDKL